MFTIPNKAAASDPLQAQWDSIDLEILIDAFQGTGVSTGLGVAAQGTPNMTVSVGAGVALFPGTSVSFGGGNVAISAADPTNPRFDLIVLSNAGVASAITGTPAAQPVFPAIPGNRVVLAAVLVVAAAASITNPRITDKRVQIGNPLASIAALAPAYGDGTTVVFVAPTPIHVLFIAGVAQKPGVDYTLSGDLLTATIIGTPPAVPDSMMYI